MCTRQIRDEVVEFGTSGYTMDHVFVLYDRTSDSVWYPWKEGEVNAVSGPWQGEAVPILTEPAPQALAAWLAKHPDSEILLPSQDDLERIKARASRGYLGIRFKNDNGTVVVQEVMADSAASHAGFEPGDVLVSIGGGAVKTRRDASVLLRGRKVGDEVEIVVERGGKPKTLRPTFMKRPPG